MVTFLFNCCYTGGSKSSWRLCRERRWRAEQCYRDLVVEPQAIRYWMMSRTCLFTFFTPLHDLPAHFQKKKLQHRSLFFPFEFGQMRKSRCPWPSKFSLLNSSTTSHITCTHRPPCPIHNQLILLVVLIPYCSTLALSSDNHCINYSSNNLLVVFTPAQKPHLTRYVRIFSIRLGSYSVLSSFYRLLTIALSNMSPLTSLDIFLDHAASWVKTSASML